MGIWARIKDGWGSSTPARINAEGAVHVISHPHPPEQTDVRYPSPQTTFFTDSNGSNDMIVAGSLANPIDFCVRAIDEGDIYIKSITGRIADNNMNLDDFGGIPELTNGMELVYQDKILGQRLIVADITTNLDLFRPATDGKGFGTGSNSWKADVSGAGAETYFPDIDIKERFGLEFGFRLQKGTNDFLCFRVRDDLAGLDTFNIQAHGFIMI